MIAKHISMRIAKKSNFRELVHYIVNAQNKLERVEHIAVTNCNENNPVLAADEITATQRQNQRARSDKTYHLLISFPAGENPTIETVHAIESRVCESLGFGEHQRISALHTDTDHLHLHIAINKIHPHRLTIHNPYCDHKKLGAICDKLEIEYGLTRVNHQATNRGAQSQAYSMESAGGLESLVGWIRRECLDGIRAAGNWQALHDTLQRNGLAIAEKGNGFVFTDSRGQQVKPSSVARDLSKPQLEKRFGVFEPSSGATHKIDKAYQRKPMPLKQDTTRLYIAYQVAQSQRASMRSQAMTKAKNHKNTLIESAKSDARQKRQAIKRLTKGVLTKKILYQLTSKTLKDEIQTINQQYRDECKALRKNRQRTSWLDWLQHRAVIGDPEALSALRARTGTCVLAGNRIAGDAAKAGKTGTPIKGLNFDSITKRGTVIYREGAAAIRDDGCHIHISKVITKKAIALSLVLAARRFGPFIKVEGTTEFKAQVVRVAASVDLAVSFADPVLEKHRQTLATVLRSQEKIHDHRHRFGRGIRKTGEQHLRQRIRAGGKLRKSGIESIGTRPPPQSTNRLRELSTRGLDGHGFGTPVLLPTDVRPDLEQHQSHAVEGLRRKVHTPGRSVGNPGEEDVVQKRGRRL